MTMHWLGGRVLFCALLGTLAVHAAEPPPARRAPAPARPAPAPAPTAALSKAIAAVTAAVVPSPNVCGQRQRVRVKLTNPTKLAWTGTIRFMETMQTVSLGPAGAPGSAQEIDVDSTSILDCKKALGAQDLRVWRSGAESTPLLAATLNPRAVKAVKDLSASAPPSLDQPPKPPGPNLPPPKPYLRKVELNATCGNLVRAVATIHGGIVASEAKLKMRFGKYVTTPTVHVPANALVPVDAGFPNFRLECQAPAGLPALEVALTDPAGASETLPPMTVLFAP